MTPMIELAIQAAFRLGPPIVEALMALFDNMKDNDEMSPEEYEQARQQIKAKRGLSDEGYDEVLAAAKARIAAKSKPAAEADDEGEDTKDEDDDA